MAAKVLEVKESAARKLLTEVKFPNAKKASAKKLGEMLGELPGKLEEDDEDPDLSKPSGTLLAKVSDAVAKERNIKVLSEGSDDDEDEEEEKPAKKGGKKTAKKKASKKDDDEDEESDDEDEEKPKKKKGKKKSGDSSASYARMKEQGAKVDKALKKRSGKATVESLAEATELSEARVQRHIDWLEKRKKVKIGKNGRISILAAEEEDDEE